MHALTVGILIVVLLVLLAGLVRSVRAMAAATRRPVAWEE